MKFSPENNNQALKGSASDAGGRKIEAPQKELEKIRADLFRNAGYSEAVLESDEKMKAIFEHILENIDVQTIQEIIGDYLLRSGVPSETWNLLKKEDFLALPHSNKRASASYYTTLNSIQMHTTYFEDKEDISFIEILRTLVHEMTHSMSHNRIVIDKKTRRGEFIKTEHVSGYHLEKKKKTSFEAFNEGVTERIANEVTVEYLKRTGNTSTYMDSFVQEIRKQTGEGFSRYGMYMFFVDMMCEKISQYSGVNKEDVWHAIIRGYFTGDSLHEQETKDLLERSLGDDFVAHLETISNKTYMGDVGTFAGMFHFPNIDAFEEKWLTHLGLEKAK